MSESEQPSSRLGIEDVSRFLFGQQSFDQPYGSFLYEGRLSFGEKDLTITNKLQGVTLSGYSLEHLSLFFLRIIQNQFISIRL